VDGRVAQTRVDISPEQHVAIVREPGTVAAKDPFGGLHDVPAIVLHVDPDYGYPGKGWRCGLPVGMAR